MHFLGAVIGAENEEEVEDILADWSEYADVEEYIAQTREEILSDGRAEDQDYLRHGKDMDARKAAAERLALNENGDAVSTFNKDSFYDYYEIGEWEGVEDMQKATCHELLERYRRDVGNVRSIINSLSVICRRDWRDGELWNGTTIETVLAELEQGEDQKVWFVNFHD